LEDNKIIQFNRDFKKKTKPATSTKRGYALFNEGMCFYRQEKDLMALDKFLQAENEGYESADMFSYIAYIYYVEKEDDEKAKLYIEKAIKTDKEYGYPYRLMALLYDDEKDYENALKYNLLAEEYKYDTNPPMMRHISELYVKLEKPNLLKALEYATKAIDLDSKNYYNWYFKGWIYYQSNDYVNALKFFKKAEDKGASDTDFYFECSYAYGELGNHEKAVEYANKYIFLDKEIFSGYYRRGYAYLLWGNFDKALESFLTAEKKDCCFSDMYCRIALIYNEKKDYKKAHEYVDKALKFNKKDGDVYFAKAAIAYAENYDFKTVVKYLKRAVKYYNLSDGYLKFEAYSLLISAYGLLGKRKLSLQTIEEALEIFPNGQYLQIMKVFALQSVRRHYEAEQLLNEHYTTEETDPVVLSFLAAYEYNKKKPKDYDKVLSYLDKISTEDYEEKKALQGFCYYEKKDYEKCLQLVYEYAQEMESKMYHSTNRGEFRKYFRRLVKMFGKNDKRLKFIAKKFSLEIK
jgi:tetratricopeptide (TPR) repeat protein